MEYMMHWLNTYIRHFKEADLSGKRKIREEIFKNYHFKNDREAEKFYELVVTQ